MTPGPAPALVSAGWLSAHLTDPAVRVAEIRTEPADPADQAGRFPGTLSWFWKDLLWDPLVRDFVSPQQAAAALAAGGITEQTTLVLWSSRPQFACYAYWVLTVMCGHADTRVLDGGRAQWPDPAGEAPAVAAPAVYRPARAARDDSSRIGRDDVLARIGARGTVILDARSAEEYAGLRVKPAPGPDHGAERAGHIPGAAHLAASALLTPDGTFRPAAELDRAFRSVGAAPDQTAQVIVYCRLGHRASLLWFAMTRLLGWEHVRVYDGSWTEWGSCVGMPVQREAAAVPLPG